MRRALLKISLTPSLRQSELDQVRRVAAPGAFRRVSRPLSPLGGDAPPGGAPPAEPSSRESAVLVKRSRAGEALQACQKSRHGPIWAQRRARKQKPARLPGRETMTAIRKTAGLRRALTGTALCGLVACGLWAAPTHAAQIGPYFPIPYSFNLSGVARDALLKTQTKWLQDGLDNLKKARAEAADDEEKVKKLDEQIAETEEEIALSENNAASHDIQRERKRKLLLNLNQWINELNRLATEQMKIAILKDGAEALAAQNRNYQLSEQADNLEKLKGDPSVQDWAATK
jgi:hypothetical protein